MLEIIAFLCLVGALVILYFLCAIDLREGLLPNELVLGFLCLGAVFHLSTVFHYLTLQDMALGAFVGGGLLYLIRILAQFIYKEDALGLGDVKLLAAAGVWLGPYHILLALIAGAAAGIIHGAGIFIYERARTKAWMDLKFLSLPAGPGFAAGIIAAGVMKFWALPDILLP